MDHPNPPPRHRLPRIGLAYAGACMLAWLLYVLAGTEVQRGLWEWREAVYQASLSLWPAMLLGALALPWVRRLQGRSAGAAVALHMLAALAFGALWQGLEFAASWGLFGVDHARAMLGQTLLWRAIWGVVVYAALAAAFSAVLQAQAARAALLSAAQAEAALARAELAAISGKLNPHFLFNTLNTLIALTRRDPQAAEQGLLRFAGMLRYVLGTRRETTERVALADEIEFVRDYLALEGLRLGARLHVEWQLDPATLADEIPPLTLQPLVENSVVHGVAPRLAGARIRIEARRNALNQGLDLTIADDGPGCDPAEITRERAPGAPGGIGLAALRRRFELDFDGRARLRVRTARGQGFQVDLWIPQT
ncbi:MAG: histidine kinase [Pelomonas sp.]|nr:histidine kinase [Roseateles sp.]